MKNVGAILVALCFVAQPVLSQSYLEDRGMFISQPQPSSATLLNSETESTLSAYHFYQQRLALQLGFAFDPEHSSPENFIWLGSLTYDFPRAYSPHLQVGLETYSSGKTLLHLSRSTTFRQRQSYRPHISLGFAHRPKAEQQLIGFLNFDNYLLRAGFGFEDLLKAPTSFRMDLSLAAGPGELLAHLTFGYSWAW